MRCAFIGFIIFFAFINRFVYSDETDDLKADTRLLLIDLKEEIEIAYSEADYKRNEAVLSITNEVRDLMKSSEDSLQRIVADALTSIAAMESVANEHQVSVTHCLVFKAHVESLATIFGQQIEVDLGTVILSGKNLIATTLEPFTNISKKIDDLNIALDTCSTSVCILQVADEAVKCGIEISDKKRSFPTALEETSDKIMNEAGNTSRTTIGVNQAYLLNTNNIIEQCFGATILNAGSSTTVWTTTTTSPSPTTLTTVPITSSATPSTTPELTTIAVETTTCYWWMGC